MFNIFITADLDYRIRQVMERRGCDEAKARKIISNGDNERASYYNYYTGKKWGASESYHLCINSSLLGLESTEKFIAQIIRERFGL